MSRVSNFVKSYTIGCANSQKNYTAGCADLQIIILLGTLFLYTRVYIQKLLKLPACQCWP